MKKILSLISVVLLTLFFCTACMTPAKTEWKLCQQPNTKWLSEDGIITFCVDDSGKTTGTMQINGEEIEIYATEGPLNSTTLHIFPIAVLQDEMISEEDKYEYWTCSYKSEERFIATVKTTTYFEEGQKITFHRVDD